MLEPIQETFGTAVIKKGEEDVTANYTVTKTPGTLADYKNQRLRIILISILLT